MWIQTDSFGNTIGGAVAGARNVISGNGVNSMIGADGVYISDAATMGNNVQGNYIGTD